MKVIVPKPIDSSLLSASNVVETPPAAYNAGTTYALGDQVSVFSGTVAACYESLQAGNTGNTPSSSPAWWVGIGTAYAVYDAGTAYALDDIVTYSHRLYQSLEAANTGNQPDTSPTKWLDIGATNRYKMFDDIVTAQTVRPGTINVDVDPGVVVNAAAFFNLSGSTIQLIMDDPSAGEVYNQTVQLIDNSEVTDWYGYFFGELLQLDKATFLDLPTYPNATVTIIVDAGVNEAKCGEAVLGRQKFLGDTNYGTSVGITDYSRKDVDDFGNFVITPRRFADRAEYDVSIESPDVNKVKKILTGIRTTPAVFIGSEFRKETIVYGFYKSFNIVISNPSFSDCSIEVEGLT